MQLSSLDVIQVERIATDNPAVFTPQLRCKFADLAKMDMDSVHLHDEGTQPPQSQAEPLFRRSLRDESNVLKTSRQHLKARSPMDRISFRIQSRKSALGLYQPPWMAGAAAPLDSVSTVGGYRWSSSTVISEIMART
jgi:hypothetical protein